MMNSNTMGHQGRQASLFILLWFCLFFFRDMLFLMGLDVDSSSCSAGFAILISSIIDICNGEIYELWPFSFLLLVMQLSEDKKKKKSRDLPCISAWLFVIKLCLSSALFAIKQTVVHPSKKKKTKFKNKNIFGLFFVGAILLYHEYYKKKLSDSEYFFFVDFWNHYE